MSGPKIRHHRCAPPCWWATGAAKRKRSTDERGMSVSHKDCLPSVSSFVFVFLCSLYYSQMQTVLCITKKKKKKNSESRGHTATFLYVLCWLDWTLPLRGWWGRMALWSNQPGASIAVIIMWIQEVLNKQLWPPVWMGNDLSVLAWHPLRLQPRHPPPSSSSSSSSVYNDAAPAQTCHRGSMSSF